MSDSLKKLVGDLSGSGPRDPRKGITVYLDKAVFERVEKHRSDFDLSRQDLVSQLISVGLEAFEAELAKRKPRKGKSGPTAQEPA